MDRYKMIGMLFVVLGVLVIFASSYFIMSYASSLLSAIVDFVTTTDFTKLQQCGVTPPAEFNKLKNELTTIVLPFLYLGIPLILIVLSVLMFLGGFYYHRGRHEDETKKVEDIERQLLRKAVKKIEKEKDEPSEEEPEEA